jgi:hypothetical protein
VANNHAGIKNTTKTKSGRKKHSQKKCFDSTNSEQVHADMFGVKKKKTPVKKKSHCY